jgi:hypothetical protein
MALRFRLFKSVFLFSDLRFCVPILQCAQRHHRVFCSLFLGISPGTQAMNDDRERKQM